MDKKTNIYNISIAVVNFINVIFLLVFSNVFNPPGMMIGVMGVIFFVYNAVFALVLLVLVLIASGYAVVSKNPDTRYQPMRDDRGSFIKSQTQLNTELDALGAAARGDMKTNEYSLQNPFDDTASISSGHGNQGSNTHLDAANAPYQSMRQQDSRSPIDTSVPLFPSNVSPPRGSPPGYDNVGRSPSSHSVRDYENAQVGASALDTSYRSQHNASPWQRGAGYENH